MRSIGFPELLVLMAVLVVPLTIAVIVFLVIRLTRKPQRLCPRCSLTIPADSAYCQGCGQRLV